MRFLERLKQISAADFPSTSLANIKQLKNTIQTESLRLAWSPDSQENPTKKELNALQTMRALCLALEKAFQPDQANRSIHELLAHLSSEDDDVLTLAVDEWADFLGEELCDEEHPLKILPHLLKGNNSAILQAAALLYLLRKNSTADAILQSGFLHQFFAHNCTDMQVVSNAYRLLSLGVKADEPCCIEANQLLKSVATVTYGISGFKGHALNGLLSKETLTQRPPKPLKLAITSTPKNWDKLYALFGHDVLFHISRADPDDTDGFLRKQTSRTLRGMSVEALHVLYQMVNTRVAEQDRWRMFHNLNASLHIDQKQALFDAGVVSAWILLSFAPELMNQIAPETLATRIHPDTLSKQHIPYAMRIVQHNTFREYKHNINNSDINNAVFELCLNDLNWPVDPKSLDHFYEDRAIRLRCHNESLLLLGALRQLITARLPLTPEGFLTITDMYRHDNFRAKRLRQFSQERSVYPSTDYELQALVIEATFEHDKDSFVSNLSCLSIMNQAILDNTVYTAEEKRNARYRSVYECLTFIDNAPLQEALFSFLDKERTAFPDLDLRSLDCHRNATKKALLNNNRAFLQQHLFKQNMSDAERLEMLARIGKNLTQASSFDTFKDDHAFILFIYMSRFLSLAQHKTTYSALFYVFSLYPTEYLTAPNSDGQTLWHKAVRAPNILTPLLEMLEMSSPENSMQHLNIRDKEGNTLLHTAMDYSMSMNLKNDFMIKKRILAAYKTPEAQLAAVKQQNNRKESVLNCLMLNNNISNKDIELILSIYPPEQRCDAVFEKNNQGIHFLHWAAERPEVLKEVLKFIPSETLFTAIQERTSDHKNRLKSHKFNPTTLLLFLNELPSEQRLNAIENEDILLNIMMKNPSIIKTMLNTLSREHRFIWVKTNMTKFQSNAASCDYFDTLAHVLSEKIEDMPVYDEGNPVQTRRRTLSFWVPGQTSKDTLKNKIKQAVDLGALKNVLHDIGEWEERIKRDETSHTRSVRPRTC